MSRIQPFGPGPGQYMAQTTFNPTLQPTPVVEQKQDLFGQLLGLVPAAAQVATQAINLGTDIKKQQYAQREAQAKLAATEANDINVLENFYEQESQAGGWVPTAVRTDATNNLADIKYSIRQKQQQEAAAIQEAQDKTLRQQEDDIFKLKIAGIKNLIETGKVNVAEQQINSLSEQYSDNPARLTDLTNLSTALFKQSQEIATKTVEDQKQAEQESRRIVGDFVKNAADIYKRLIESDPNITPDGVSENIDLALNQVAKNTGNLSLLEKDKDGKYKNKDLQIAVNQATSVVYAELFAKNKKQYDENITNRYLLNLESSFNNILKDPELAALNFQAVQEYVASRSPEEQITLNDKVSQIFNQGLTNLSTTIDPIVGESTPIEAAQAMAYVSTLVLKSGFALTAQTSEAFNRLRTNASKWITNDVSKDMSKNNLNINIDYIKNKYVIDPSSKNDSGVTLGQLYLVESLQRQLGFSDEVLGRILDNESFGILLQQSESPDAIAVNSVINMYEDLWVQYEGEAAQQKNSGGMSPSDLETARVSGQPLNPKDSQHIILPSQQLETMAGKQVVKSSISLIGNDGSPITLDNDAQNKLYFSNDPADANLQLQYFSMLASQDSNYINRGPFAEKHIQSITDDLESKDPRRMRRAMATFTTYDGFKNPSVRQFIGEKYKNGEDFAVLANIANIYDPVTHRYNLPDGQTLVQFATDIRTFYKNADDIPNDKREKAKSWDLLTESMGVPGLVADDNIKNFLMMQAKRSSFRKAGDIGTELNAILNKNGFVVVRNVVGYREIVPDVMGYTIPEKDLADTLTSKFKTLVPEQYRAAYAEHFGLDPNFKFERFDELLAASIQEGNFKGVSLTRLYDLEFFVSYDNELSNYNLNDPANFDPRNQFGFGGILLAYDTRAEKYIPILDKNGTQIRIRPDTMNFPMLSKELTAKLLEKELPMIGMRLDPKQAFIEKQALSFASEKEKQIRLTWGLPVKIRQ